MNEHGYETPTEVIDAWEDKQLREGELITILGNWSYSGPFGFDEVSEDTRLPDHVYDAVLELYARKRAGD